MLLNVWFDAAINVSGFQLLKLELSLTPSGLQSQSDVIAAVFDSISTISNEGNNSSTSSFQIPANVLAQYANTAELYGYLLTPRPPDAVELAVDTINYGVDVVNSRKWYRFPSTDPASNKYGLQTLQRKMNEVLKVLSDPNNALIITSSSDLSKISRKGINGVEPFNPSLPVSALLYRDDSNKVKKQQSNQLDDQFHSFPTNNFVPITLASPRPLSNSMASVIMDRIKSNDYDSSKTNSSNKNARPGWAVLVPKNNNLTPAIPLPRSPPEPTVRCVFVLQLLSSKPARATAEQAAYGDLWRQSFEEAIYELSEQGALGGLAYELRFNQWGLKVCFLGIRQNIREYTKQVMEQLIKHHISIQNGECIINNYSRSNSIFEAKRARNLTPGRRNIIIQTLQKAKEPDVAQEGLQFLQSCSGAVCFSQGDLTYEETKELLYDIEEIFDTRVDLNSKSSKKGQVLKSALPSIEDLVGTPTWKPRNATPCYLSGMSLMSDACGRVLR